MNDQILGVFKICLLVLLYLFFGRVLWAVWSEVRAPRLKVADPRSAPLAANPNAGEAPVPARSVPIAKPAKGKRGSVGRLVVIEPRARKGLSFAVTGEVTIGRAAGCTVSIPDDTFLSQLHARVFRENGEAYVEDLGSTNGSFLNGNKLSLALQLRRGDRIQIGNTVLEAE
jgi:pSer/pThr/pTyr-binding forkhead associated (FHA) protein